VLKIPKSTTRRVYNTNGMLMTPIESYQQDIALKKFTIDHAQEVAVNKTQQLFDKLVSIPTANTKKTSSIFDIFKSKKVETIKGLYFWGGVGRGKSYIIDQFYDCLPFNEKRRIHYNHFMQNIHSRLQILPKAPNPLIIVANEVAEKYRVLCIDEFHVDDITDAMIMGGFLSALFAKNVTLVTTSNIEPDKLYLNGLQRDRFLPAIELIKENTVVLNLDNGVDYRLAMLEKNGVFHLIENSDNGIKNGDILLEDNLSKLANTNINTNQTIRIKGREIKLRARSDNQVWFDFYEICQTPRSSADYLEIARDFETVIISSIPIMDDSKNDVVQRFIQLIDALYDHKVKFLATAFANPGQLYTGKRLAFEFKRTQSRLYEMKSEKYLSQAHIPN